MIPSPGIIMHVTLIVSDYIKIIFIKKSLCHLLFILCVICYSVYQVHSW